MLDSIVNSNVYKKLDSRKFSKYFNLISSILLVLGLIIISSQIKKSCSYIANELEVVVIHDTLLVKPPEVQFCFKCNSELKGIHDHPVSCCGFKYTFRGNKLFAEKDK